MNLQSLIAHNGVIHQPSHPAVKPKPPNIETTKNKNKIDSQIAVPSSNNSSDKQTIDLTDKTHTNQPTEALTIETPTAPDSASFTLFPGLGESIFALLIVSPFLLLGLKKWLHR